MQLTISQRWKGLDLSRPAWREVEPRRAHREWRVAMALDALGFEYQYQRSIGGGRSIRGGQVVDFWIYTAPKPTPAFVQGAYWHKQATSSEDDIKQAKVQHLYAGRVMPNLLLEEKYLGSVASATAYLRRELIG